MNQGNKLNYVIFLVLSFAIIIGSSFLLNKSSDKTPKPDTAAENQGKQKSPLESTFTPGTENIAQKQHIEDIKIPKSPKGKLITVTTPLFVAKIDSFGGRIIEWDLLDYKETTKAGSPDVNLFSNTPSSFNPFIWIDNIKMPDFIPFQYDGRSNINITNYKKEIALRWTSPEGIEVKNIYEIDPGSYLIKQRFEIMNNGNADIVYTIIINWVDKLEQKGRGEDSSYFLSLISDELEEVKKDPKEKVKFSGEVQWFGFSSKYFMTTLLPEIGGTTTVSISPTNEKNTGRALYTYPTEKIKAGKSSIKSWQVYLGPKEYSILKTIGFELDRAVNFGWASFLSIPLLEFLRFLNRYINNYGITIIVVTVIIRLLFLPLTIKSMVSMKKMQVKMESLKPKINALKEKLKDDKTKQNSELMKLYTAHGVNPLSSLGGCLPLLIQIPVFFALYEVLLHSIDLRHSAFLWISDLAEPETLFTIPFIGIPFRALPLLMGVSWFISQKMTPMGAPASDQMQLQMKMMQFMPIIFTFMFWGLPSGLILYWTVSNILSIGQQIYVNRKIKVAIGG